MNVSTAVSLHGQYGVDGAELDTMQALSQVPEASDPEFFDASGSGSARQLCYGEGMDETAQIAAVRRHFDESGFAFVDAHTMRAMIARFGSLGDWEAFAASWNELELDTYLQEHGRFRRRRHAVFSADGDGLTRQPHQPHFQSADYNRLFGGIERWFEPMQSAIGDSASLRSVLRFCVAWFGDVGGTPPRWRIEVHQFRIEAKPSVPGLPTPEGVHRDGVDYVLVLLICRENIVSGTTTIHAPDGAMLGSFTLAQPFDAALVDDARVLHGVTPVEPLEADRPAFRDVLVVTLRRV